MVAEGRRENWRSDGSAHPIGLARRNGGGAADSANRDAVAPNFNGDPIAPGFSVPRSTATHERSQPAGVAQSNAARLRLRKIRQEDDQLHEESEDEEAWEEMSDDEFFKRIDFDDEEDEED